MFQCGVMNNMNLSFVLFVFPCPDVNPGTTKAPRGPQEYCAPCLNCGRLISNGDGVFCANFWARREIWPPCNGSWCGRCYEASEEDGFPIHLPQDAMGEYIVRGKDRDHFMCVRGGDHWVTRFQCDLCHFRNLQGRNPRDNSGIDSLLLRCIRRANLDALWSRETGTVRGLHGEILRMSRKAKILGLNPERFYPTMGPLPVKDIDGMAVACCVLMHSLDEGKNEDTVQFKTANFSRTAYGNMWHASAQGGLAAVVVRDTTKMFHTSCPTFSDWYE